MLKCKFDNTNALGTAKLRECYKAHNGSTRLQIIDDKCLNSVLQNIYCKDTAVISIEELRLDHQITINNMTVNITGITNEEQKINVNMQAYFNQNGK